MFADSLLESSWEIRSHRGCTTLASYAVQLLGLGMLLFLPLLYTEVLPKLRLLSRPTCTSRIASQFKCDQYGKRPNICFPTQHSNIDHT